MSMHILTCFKSFNSSRAELIFNSFASLYPDSNILLYCVCKHIDDFRIFPPYVEGKNFDYIDKNQSAILVETEKSFFGNSLYSEIYAFKSQYEKTHMHRFGWIVQQLVKLYAPVKYGRTFLIFDSDTIPLKKLRSFTDTKCMPYFRERNTSYGFFVHSVLAGDLPYHPIQTTYIAQHMLFDPSILISLFNQWKQTCKILGESSIAFEEFIVWLSRLSARNNKYRLSEFELYGNFLQASSNCAIIRSKIRIARHGKIIENLFGLELTIKFYRYLNCDLIAFENWSKIHHAFEILLLLATKWLPD